MLACCVQSLTSLQMLSAMLHVKVTMGPAEGLVKMMCGACLS